MSPLSKMPNKPSLEFFPIKFQKLIKKLFRPQIPSYISSTENCIDSEKIALPNGEVEGGLSRWSNDSIPDCFLSVRSL